MVEDLDGNKFLDWIGGVGVLNIGYSNPEVIEAVKAQSENYFHTIFNVIVHYRKGCCLKMQVLPVTSSGSLHRFA